MGEEGVSGIPEKINQTADDEVSEKEGCRNRRFSVFAQGARLTNKVRKSIMKTEMMKKEESEKYDKWVTVYVGGYPNGCTESKVPIILENVENLKKMYLEKGVAQEILDELYSIRIVKDED